MSSLDKAVETQLQNIEKKSGKSREALAEIIRNSGLSKHGELRTLLMQDYGLGYGDANTMVHYALKSDVTRAAEAHGLEGDSVLDEIYTGAKAGLRPIHEKLTGAIDSFGEYETAPKKGYVSLRRKKQFAMLGPGTKGRMEIGLNVKDLPVSERLAAQPAGGMCNYKVFLTSPEEVDTELLGWIKQAFDSAG